MHAYIVAALLTQVFALGFQFLSKDETNRAIALGINVAIGCIVGIGGLINVLSNL